VTSERRAPWLLALDAALILAWSFAFPAWPDDWDGLGFLASIHHFDLASFAPHPPGYPVYVALLKLVALVGFSPLGAARVVAIASGLVTYDALTSTLQASASPRLPRSRAALGAAALCLTPLVFRCFSGVGSEGPALAFAALAALGALDAERRVRSRTLLVGVAVGLGLGVRLSWAPCTLPFLLLLPRGVRLRGLCVALLACLAWAIPLVLLTGAPQLVTLARTHLAGHMTVWGGTALTEPTRLPYLLRDLFVDGLACDRTPLGIATAVLLVCTAASALRRFPSSRLPVLSLFALPYLAWVTFGQNLKDQPRHVVPLVALLTFVLARSLLLATPPARFRLVVAGLLVALLSARTAIEAERRVLIPPAGVQLLAYLRAHSSDASPADTAVFAGESGRFLDGTEWQRSVHPAATTGDALLAISRLPASPSHVFVTSELRDLPASPPIATFCRPSRIARRLPCLNLYAWDGTASPAP